MRLINFLPGTIPSSLIKPNEELIKWFFKQMITLTESIHEQVLSELQTSNGLYDNTCNTWPVYTELNIAITCVSSCKHAMLVTSIKPWSNTVF